MSGLSAFRVEPDVAMDIIPIIGVFLLTLVVTLSSALKGAVANPVDSIKHE